MKIIEDLCLLVYVFYALTIKKIPELKFSYQCCCVFFKALCTVLALTNPYSATVSVDLKAKKRL